MFNKYQYQILILLIVVFVVKSYQEKNLTMGMGMGMGINITNHDLPDLNYLEDNLNNYNILPFIICLYFININI